MSNLAVFVPVLLLAIFVSDGETYKFLNCWSCSTETDKRCAEKLNGDPEKDYLDLIEKCEPGPTMMNEQVFCKKEERLVKEKTVITRGCSYKLKNSYPPRCPEPLFASAKPKYCSLCTGHGCNDADTTGTTIALLLAPLGLLLFK